MRRARWKVLGALPGLGVLMFLQFECAALTTPDLKVSKDGHFLINRDESPFYWIGDTGWALFQQLTREEIDLYLDHRKSMGFTIIHAVAFWFPHGVFDENGPLHAANAYGHYPFVGDSLEPQTSRPLIAAGGTTNDPNDYWDHADYVVDAVKKRGLKLLLLPCWGNAFINDRMPGSSIVFTEIEARKYGRFLGERYGSESHIIWCLGGDVDPVNFGSQDQRMVYRAMAEGIGRGSSGNMDLLWNVPDKDWDQSLITFHAVRTPKLSGEGAEGGSSSLWFHHDIWLDFNMMETFRWMHKIYPYVREDYQKKPAKPTVLGEGAYEVGRYKNDCGFITPHKVRRQGYHAFFAGAAGYTYGHWSIWPFRGAYCEISWQTALDAPGAADVAQVMKNFVKGHNIYSFTPDPLLILTSPLSGEDRQCAMINHEEGKILIYLPDCRELQLDMSRLPRDEDLTATWFDPRNGHLAKESMQRDGIFHPPADWEDAILIIE